MTIGASADAFADAVDACTAALRPAFAVGVRNCAVAVAVGTLTVALRYAVIVEGIAVAVAVAVGTLTVALVTPYAYCPYLKDPYFIGAPPLL